MNDKEIIKSQQTILREAHGRIDSPGTVIKRQDPDNYVAILPDKLALVPVREYGWQPFWAVFEWDGDRWVLGRIVALHLALAWWGVKWHEPVGTIIRTTKVIRDPTGDSDLEIPEGARGIVVDSPFENEPGSVTADFDVVIVPLDADEFEIVGPPGTPVRSENSPLKNRREARKS